MTLSTVAHDTFVIERAYDIPVAQVFRAWSDPRLKARWFAGSADALGSGYELASESGARSSIAVALRVGPSSPTFRSIATSFPNNGSSTPTRCSLTKDGFPCRWPQSSSRPRGQRPC
jgi:hypothetical protein